MAIKLKRGDLANEGEGLGELEGKPMTTGTGRYGPFIKHDDKDVYKRQVHVR